MQEIYALTEKLYNKINSVGLKGKIISTSHLIQLKEDILTKRNDRFLDDIFYKECLSFFKFSPSLSLAGANSIIIVSVPQPKISVSFQWRKNRFYLTIPPTYLHAPDDMVREILEQLLEPYGYRIEQTYLPLKNLAARSGLAEYGKNNITYVPGSGSFHRLVGFYSDLPCLNDSWQEPKTMAACLNCSACLKSCPTGAITKDRFLIKAERCLTFHNERKAAFPGWFKPDWHHCLVGCLRCQSVCPVNKHIFKWEEKREHFSEEETLMILKGYGKKKLPSSTLNKIERLSLTEYLEQLPRNLEAVLKNEKNAQ